MAIQQSCRWIILITVLILFVACGDDQSADGSASEIGGKEFYSNNCTVCHGESGADQRSGAKDLTISTLKREQVRKTILKGQGTMSAYERFFENDSIGLEKLIDHVISLRK